MISNSALWQEIQQGESKTLEFKQQLPKGEQLAKTLIAFANTSGGKLIVGVNDERQIVGIKTYEIPMAAIREALINAIIHRDYSNFGRDIKVGIYDDALNIVSPGGLPHGITLNEALQGRSEIRNKVLARVFKALGYIEQWGSGIARIQQLCHQADCQPPIFKETGDFFDIEFLRDVQEEPDSEGGPIGGQVGGPIGGQITESQRSVLLLIQNKPQISRQELAKALQINPSAVQKHIENLKEQGVIERIGGTRGYWQVKI